MSSSSSMGNFEFRLKKLEEDYDREISRMLEILEKIQIRLVGSLDDRSCTGLIGEVKEIQSELNASKIKIAEIKLELEQLKSARASDAQVMNQLVEMKKELPAIQKTLKIYDRYRWLIAGGLLVIGFLFSKIWEFFVRWR